MSHSTHDDLAHEAHQEQGAVSGSSRRTFLSRLVAAGFGAAVLGTVASAQAATKPQQPAADTGHNYPMAKPHAMTAQQFYMGVIGPATLSKITSEIAVDKATNAHAKEFANFELREAIAVTTVLMEMGVPTPPMDATGKAILAKLKSSDGATFDKTYIMAQLSNHEFLRDHAATYLANSSGHTGMAETHGRHLALLTLNEFKEHVVLTKNISAELQG